jgi:predicted regulator of Ras-like GTPase activity (Roadblock/LC7/MglB family)
MLKWHVKLAAFGALKGWRAISVADGLDRFEKVYSEADLHLGYRVHSHIFSLSNRSASILVNEDTRGVGQVQTLGGEILMAGAGAKPILKAVETHLVTKGANSANGVAVMKGTFPTMVKFLESI